VCAHIEHRLGTFPQGDGVLLISFGYVPIFCLILIRRDVSARAFAKGPFTIVFVIIASVNTEGVFLTAVN
jgi:hypothetical protein